MRPRHGVAARPVLDQPGKCGGKGPDIVDGNEDAGRGRHHLRHGAGMAGDDRQAMGQRFRENHAIAFVAGGECEQVGAGEGRARVLDFPRQHNTGAKTEIGDLPLQGVAGCRVERSAADDRCRPVEPLDSFERGDQHIMPLRGESVPTERMANRPSPPLAGGAASVPGRATVIRGAATPKFAVSSRAVIGEVTMIARAAASARVSLALNRAWSFGETPVSSARG